ncbi:MAG TPA: DarT ssDNA thymidine ADP-ribosyltransferase family protein [Defluviitaleaceae bacterium]|nr:DarT ssDNA thymidine ADP-ribosyltransferase family protein [Defluviitaleaceae bacterium]
MAEQRLEYPTHSLILREVDNTKFIKVTNFVKDVIYQEMLDSYFTNPNNNFVFEERKLLNNFVKSLTSFHNRIEDLPIGTPEMYIFGDDAEYYIFCMVNDLKYEEQEWFKTIYIKATFLYSITLFIGTSVSFLKTLYPDHYKKPVNLLEEVFRKLKQQQDLYKCNVETYVDFLIENKIDRLYHFSNRQNLESIKKNGICSISEMKRLGISSKYSSSDGSRVIDSTKQLSEYVHLSYERDTPMLYIALAEGRLYDYVIFEITPDVIFYKETKFSNINAASNEAVISSDINFFLNLPFSSFHNKKYSCLSDQAKKNYQAEVLVKNNIPTNQILNLKSYE